MSPLVPTKFAPNVSSYVVALVAGPPRPALLLGHKRGRGCAPGTMSPLVPQPGPVCNGVTVWVAVPTSLGPCAHRQSPVSGRLGNPPQTPAPDPFWLLLGALPPGAKPNPTPPLHVGPSKVSFAREAVTPGNRGSGLLVAKVAGGLLEGALRRQRGGSRAHKGRSLGMPSSALARSGKKCISRILRIAPPPQ
jgi:hypothetical protein